MTKQIGAIVILATTLVIVTGLYISESNKTKISGDWLEDAIIEKATYEDDVDKETRADLTEYLRRDQGFQFENVINLYDEEGEGLHYRVYYRYTDDEEVIVTKVDQRNGS